MLKNALPHQIFVTGTDTDVGKTVLAGVLCQGLRATYWKPVQAGFPTDSETIAGWIGADRVLPETRVLTHPLSPNQAAERDAVQVKLADFRLPQISEPLVVEGAGGLFVPLNQDHMIIDLIHHLGLPVVIAARSGLGTLNHTLLSVEALKRRHIPIAGIVLIGPPSPDNARDIAHFGGVPILGTLSILPELSESSLAEAFKTL